jgi:hypothetical protein
MVNAIGEWYRTVEPFRGVQPCAAFDLGEIARVLPARELAKLLRKDPRVLQFESVTRPGYLEADNIHATSVRRVEQVDLHELCAESGKAKREDTLS